MVFNLLYRVIVIYGFYGNIYGKRFKKVCTLNTDNTLYTDIDTIVYLTATQAKSQICEVIAKLKEGDFMKQKLLKLIYIIDGIVLIINLAYFSMVYLSRSLQSTAYAVESYKLLHFQIKLQKVIEFGLYYETAAMFLFYSFLVILITAIFSAVFYCLIISKTTYLLMVLSPLTMLMQFVFMPIFLIFGIDELPDIITAIWYLICFLGLLLYTVFTGIFMCKDLKSFSALKA